jgi:hypothetical protein
MSGQQNIRDNTGGNRGKDIIAVHADPLVTTRGRLQAVLMPVVHDIIAIAILGRQPLTLMPVTVWNGAPSAAH